MIIIVVVVVMPLMMPVAILFGIIGRTRMALVGLIC